MTRVDFGEDTPIVEKHYEERQRGSLWNFFYVAVPARYCFVVLASLGFVNIYAMRVNLSVALVAMINHTALHGMEDIDFASNVTDSPIDQCKSNADMHLIRAEKDGEFIWDQKTQGLILGSFFYGYIVTQLPGGRIAELVSGKWLFGGGILVTALLTLLTPVAARMGVWCLVILRVLEGLGEGVTFPAMHSMLAKWSPPMERSKMSTITYTGAQVGTVISLLLSGILADSDMRWPSVFYFFGVFGVVWFAFWAYLAYDNPMDHPFISRSEQNYIVNSIGDSHGYTEKPLPVPWRSMLVSLPVWAIVVAHFGHNWGFYTLLTELPSYMRSILHHDIQQNGFLSCIPYIGMWAFAIIASSIADYMRMRRMLTTTAVRKLFHAFSQVMPAICLLLLTMTGCDAAWSVIFLSLAGTFNGAAHAGYMTNHIDIAPRFSGTLFGITNTVATIPGFLAPQIVGRLTQKNESLAQWSKVFYLSSIIYVISALIFVACASGEEQPWNRFQYRVDKDSDDDEDTENEEQCGYASPINSESRNIH